MYWEGLYAIPLLATAMTCGLAVFLAREVPFAGRTALIVVLLGAAEWSLGSFFEISVEHLNVKIFWDNLQFLGYSSVVPGIVIFVLTYRRQSFRLPRWLVGGLFVEPVATNVLAWTNNLHGLIRIRPVIEEYGAFSLLAYEWGAWMWISTTYVVLLYLVSFLFFVGRVRRMRSDAGPVPTVVSIGLLIPGLAGIVLVTGVVGYFDFLPLFFAIGAAVVAWGVSREELIPLSASTYQRIVENAGSGIAVLDGAGRILRYNPMAATALQVEGPELIGQRAADLLPHGRALQDAFDTGASIDMETSIAIGEETRHYRIRTQPIILRRHGDTGNLVLIDDISRLKRSEEELRKSTERFHNLQHNLADKVVFYAYTGDGMMTYLSEGGKKLGLLSPEDAVGKHAGEVARWTKDSMPVERYHRRVLKSGNLASSNFVLSYVNPEGQTRYLSFYQYPVRSEEGLIIEGVGIDITTEKETEQQLATLGMAVENAQVSVQITDSEARIKYVNPFFTQVTGYTREEVVGCNPRILQSGYHGPALYREMWDTLTAGKTWWGELRNCKKDGNYHWEKVIITPIRDQDGNILQYVGVKEDITTQKQIEQLKEDVDRIWRHDVKTPLNTIINLPELLLRSTNLTEDQKEDLSLISHSGREVLEASNQSVTLLAVESGAFEYRADRLDLAILVKQCIREQKAIAATKAVQIGGPIYQTGEAESAQVMVLGDRILAYSVIFNLLKYAIEASPDGQNVSVSFHQSEWVTLSINHTALVPDEMRSAFFEKHSPSGSHGGIGPYIAKTFAEAQGWVIQMETGITDGTNLTLQIPASQEI